jgi:glycolate oxidase
VVNLAIGKAVAGSGYFYAPDPSASWSVRWRQRRGELRGATGTFPSCDRVELCTPDGELTWLGTRLAAEAPGYDLVGVVVGSEGTLGIATKVAVRLLRSPQAVTTLLAAFRTVADAGAATSAIIAAGLTPAAAEIMDALAIRAAERAVDCRHPGRRGAVLIVECDGPAAEVDVEVVGVVRLCRRRARSRCGWPPIPRSWEIWRGRKSAFAAVGRISPDQSSRTA